MKRRYPIVILLSIFASGASAQCTIDLPSDTVTIYWGYDPLACTTLAPNVNGAQPTSLLWSDGSITSSISVCDTASTWYYVTLTDDTLCTATDSVFVNVVDVHCGNNDNKVLVCHIPPGNPANAHTICISENGVPAHLAHGCVLGACAPADSVMNANNLQMTVSPNPMSAAAAVQVSSRTAQRVRVSVIDALGRRTQLLLDATMAAEEVRVLQLDSDQFPAGTSVVWVEASGESDRIVQRIVLLR